MSLPKSARTTELVRGVPSKRYQRHINPPASYEPAKQYIADSELGPAMAALNDRQRVFVLALVQDGCNRAEAARRAGYAGDRETLKTSGYRLAHDPKVQAALHEESLKLMRDTAPMAIGVLREVASNPAVDPKARIKAAAELLSRSGLGVTSEHKVTVEKSVNPDALIAEIVSLARRLDLDPEKLVGRGQRKLPATFVDAEFTEVAPAIPEELEDIL